MGINTPESRTRDLEEKARGLAAKDRLKAILEGANTIQLTSHGVGKYGRLLGWLYIGDELVSLNEQMIEEGYAWSYDGGTKKKDFQELRDIRIAKGTLTE